MGWGRNSPFLRIVSERTGHQRVRRQMCKSGGAANIRMAPAANIHGRQLNGAQRWADTEQNASVL